MFKKILLATDGSEDAFKAADFALELAQKNDAMVEIMFVVPVIPLFGPQKVINQGLSTTAEMETHAKEIIAQTGKKFDELKIPYHTKIISGDPASLICDHAKENGVQLIVIGTRGNTGVTRWVMGSVSSKVVSHAPCSVLVVR